MLIAEESGWGGGGASAYAIFFFYVERTNVTNVGSLSGVLQEMKTDGGDEGQSKEGGGREEAEEEDDEEEGDASEDAPEGPEVTFDGGLQLFVS